MKYKIATRTPLGIINIGFSQVPTDMERQGFVAACGRIAPRAEARREAAYIANVAAELAHDARVRASRAMMGVVS